MQRGSSGDVLDRSLLDRSLPHIISSKPHGPAHSPSPPRAGPMGMSTSMSDKQLAADIEAALGVTRLTPEVFRALYERFKKKDKEIADRLNSGIRRVEDMMSLLVTLAAALGINQNGQQLPGQPGGRPLSAGSVSTSLPFGASSPAHGAVPPSPGMNDFLGRLSKANSGLMEGLDALTSKVERLEQRLTEVAVARRAAGSPAGDDSVSYTSAIAERLAGDWEVRFQSVQGQLEGLTKRLNSAVVSGAAASAPGSPADAWSKDIAVDVRREVMSELGQQIGRIQDTCNTHGKALAELLRNQIELRKTKDEADAAAVSFTATHAAELAELTRQSGETRRGLAEAEAKSSAALKALETLQEQLRSAESAARSHVEQAKGVAERAAADARHDASIAKEDAAAALREAAEARAAVATLGGGRDSASLEDARLRLAGLEGTVAALKSGGEEERVRRLVEETADRTPPRLLAPPRLRIDLSIYLSTDTQRCCDGRIVSAPRPRRRTRRGPSLTPPRPGTQTVAKKVQEEVSRLVGQLERLASEDESRWVKVEARLESNRQQQAQQLELVNRTLEDVRKQAKELKGQADQLASAGAATAAPPPQARPAEEAAAAADQAAAVEARVAAAVARAMAEAGLEAPALEARIAAAVERHAPPAPAPPPLLRPRLPPACQAGRCAREARGRAATAAGRRCRRRAGRAGRGPSVPQGAPGPAGAVLAQMESMEKIVFGSEVGDGTATEAGDVQLVPVDIQGELEKWEGRNRQAAEQLAGKFLQRLKREMEKVRPPRGKTREEMKDFMARIERLETATREAIERVVTGTTAFEQKVKGVVETIAAESRGYGNRSRS
eukprot:tig00020944_g16380.t1